MVVLVTVLLLTAAGLSARVYRGALRSNVGELSFRNRLRIPALATAEADTGGGRVFRLEVGTGQSSFLNGEQTPTFTVNGTYLGPTVRARQGEHVRVDVTNQLREVTTVHWHGMHLPSTADGGPHQPIAPGQTWSPSWTIEQPPATLWYHAHPEGRTGEQVYRGVAGLFLVDPEVDDAALPNRYGVDDVPLVIQDRRFTSDAEFDLSSTRFSSVGPLGDQILVNGTQDPYLPVSTSLVRFRVLNASNARTYNLGFDDDRPYWVIAGDASLLPAPHAVTRLLVAPSERAEIVVAMAPGEDAILRSYPTRLEAGNLPRRFSGGDDSFDLLELRAEPALQPSSPLPERLGGPAPVDAGPGSPVRTFTFNHASRLNGRVFDPARTDVRVAPNSTELWELRNGSDNQHVFHVHGVSFTIVAYDRGPPPPERAGLKDSVLLPPGSTVRLAVRFERWEDASTPYLFHCHLLAHEDHGMMGQFVVAR